MNARAVLLLGGHGDGEIVTIPYDANNLRGLFLARMDLK